MKVILIKDCDAGKMNQVIEVADGYAKNFLIKKGLALPINKSTKHAHEQELKRLATKKEAKLNKALALKAKLENLTLVFKLKTTDLKVHGSITKKQILLALKKQNFNIDNHAIGHTQINTLGITTIKVKLEQDVFANLKVEVEPHAK